jgi:hypothetical protein
MSVRIWVIVGIMTIVGALFGFEYRAFVDRADMIDSNSRVIETRNENRGLKANVTELNKKIEALQSKLASEQAALEAIVPSKNAYNLFPNKSVIAADGHLSLGLVGPPTNEGITLNVNGTQHSVSAGEVINTSPDRTTDCEIRIQSFDSFKALVTALCAPASPKKP